MGVSNIGCHGGNLQWNEIHYCQLENQIRLVIKVAYLANDMALRMPSQKQETMIPTHMNHGPTTSQSKFNCKTTLLEVKQMTF